MNILITGISGFIAGHLKDYFELNNHVVFGVSRSSKLLGSQHYNLTLPDSDIYNIVAQIKPDVVIHAAGTASVPKSVTAPYTDFDISVPATAMLLDAIRKFSPEAHLVFLSSAAVYGNPVQLPISETDSIQPISPYGYHKRMGELLCEEYHKIYGLKTSVVRIFSAYGLGLERQVVFDLINRAREAVNNGDKQLDIIGTGKESRDFIHVSDVVAAIGLLIDSPESFGVYNLGSGVETSIESLIRVILDSLNSDLRLNYSNTIRKGDPINWVANISKLRKLGFQPLVTLKQGIGSIVTGRQI